MQMASLALFLFFMREISSVYQYCLKHYIKLNRIAKTFIFYHYFRTNILM